MSALVQRGNVLQGEVEGSQYLPYRVRVSLDEGGITGATCSCPYDWGGWCKHIVATLLACLDEPETIEVRPALEELLAELDGEQLQDLLLYLAARDPGLADEIESQIDMHLLIGNLTDLKAIEAAPLMEKAFAANRVDLPNYGWLGGCANPVEIVG